MDSKKEYSVVVENEGAAEAFWWCGAFGKMALAIARERGLLDAKEKEDEEGAHEDGLQNAATN